MTVWVDPLDGTAEYTQVRPTYLQCCGSGMFIPDRNFPCRIPDSGSRPKNTSKWRNFEKKTVCGRRVWNRFRIQVHWNRVRNTEENTRWTPPAVLWIRDILVRIWSGSADPDFFVSGWQDANKKKVFSPSVFCFYFLKVPYIFISFHR